MAESLKQKAEQSVNGPDTPSGQIGQIDVTVGEAELAIVYRTESKNNVKQFVASCTPPDEEKSPHLLDFVEELFPSLSLPDGFGLDFSGGVLLTQKEGTGTKWLLGMDLSAHTITLDQFPLIGQISSDSTNIVGNFRVIVASQPFKASEINQANLTLTALSKEIEGEAAPLPVPASAAETQVVIKKGFTLTSRLNFGDVEKPLALPVSDGTGNNEGAPDAPTGDGASGKEYAVWYKVQKSLGPLTIEKVGGQYSTEDQELLLLLTSDIKVGPFGLGLQGLGLGLPLDGSSPSFHLNGFSMAYDKSPLEIGAAFLRREREGYVEYDGLVTLKAQLKGQSLGFGAIGSYAYFKGQPSLFIYALLNYPLGGPPFFFVTGLAGGFGYNRALTMPKIDKMGEFPLVAEASDSSYSSEGGLAERIETELEKIDEYIAPELGAGFLALGVKFTSFKMIDAFALAILTWGSDISLNLLGVATLVVPTPAEGKEIKPLGMAKLLIRVTVDFSEGLIAAMAQLDPSSYILSTACHLTGGFAFYIWFAGEHAGDFVVSLGGYSASFDKPEHYPDVPRLGFNWQIDPSALIKGDLYFALCSHAFMVGGHVEASYNKGSVKAWFRAGLDFLIAWKPYHYEARIYVDLGASVGIISVDVGADVSLWGPEFGGKAKISLFIVHVTVTFGDQGSTEPEPIDWSTFKSSFLPDGSNQPASAASGMQMLQQSDSKAVCSLAVSKGLIKQTDDWHIINAKEFAIATDSLIPSKQAYSGSQSLSHHGAQTEFGISPMALSHDQVHTTHTITITREGQAVDNWFDYQPILKKAPTGLWGQSLKPDVNQERFIENALTGYEVSAKPPHQPNETTQVAADNLRYSLNQDEIEAYQWQTIDAFEHISSNASQQTLLDALGMSV